jgi:hypothetical protein
VIKKALSPVDVIKVEIDEENQKANAYILVSQRAKAV